MAISTNGLQLVRLAGAVFNQRLSASDYSEILASNKTAAELDAWANAAVASEFRNKTTTDIAKAVLANVGLSSVAGLEAWVAGQLNAGGGVAKAGATMIALLNDYSNMNTTEAIYGASVVAFNAKVANSQAQSQTAGTATGTFAAVTAVAPSERGATFTLTGGIDSIEGGSGGDTITGTISATATLTSLNAGDTINGGAGNDTFISSIASATTTLSGVSITDVETIRVQNSTAAISTLDMSISKGYTSLENYASSASSTVGFSNVSKISDAAMRYGSSDLTITYLSATVTGAADSQNLTLEGAQGGVFTSSGIESLNIKTATTDSGSSSSFSTLSAGTANTANKATIAATNKLYMTLSDTSLKTIDLTGSTATTGIDISAAVAAQAINVTGGSGNDTLVITGVGTSDSIDGGDGTDTLRFVATDNTTTGTTGTTALGGVKNFEAANGVVAAVTGATTYAISSKAVTGISTYSASLTSTDLVTAQGGAVAATLGLTVPQAAATVSVSTARTNEFNANTTYVAAADTVLTIAPDTDTAADTVTVNFSGFGNAIATGLTANNYAYGLGTLTVASHEAVTINSNQNTGGTASGNSLELLTASGAKTLTIGGTVDLQVNSMGAASLLKTIDASGLSANRVFFVDSTDGNATVSAATAVTTAANTLNTTGRNITLGGGNNVVQTGAGGDTVTGGAGNDVIFTGFTGTATTVALGDVISGGLGDDSIIVGARVDRLTNNFNAGTTPAILNSSGTPTAVLAAASAGQNVSGGAGNDTISAYISALTNADTINGGEGTDTLRLVFAGTTTLSVNGASSSPLKNVSNVESINLFSFAPGATADSATVTITDAGLNSLGGSVAFSAYGGSTGATDVVAVDASGVLASGGTISLAPATGNSGNIYYVGGMATDKFTGGSGADSVIFNNPYALSNVDTLAGGTGSDTLYLNSASNPIILSAAQLTNVTGFESINVGGFSAYSAVGGTVTASASTNAVTLTIDEVFASGNAANSSGAVSIIRGATDTGALTVNASTATTAVSVTGGIGSDTITGGAGADTITGNAGSDSLSGGAGNDVFAYAADATIGTKINGGDGADSIRVTADANLTGATITEVEAVSVATGITGTFSADQLSSTTVLADVGTIAISVTGTGYNASAYTVAGSRVATNTLGVTTSVASPSAAESFGTTVIGSPYADVIVGGGAADTISGGAGVDTITGGAGLDVITTGSGADIINFGQVESSRDTITDFAVGAGGDIIDVSSAGALTALGALVAQVAGGTTAAVAHANNTILFLSSATRAAFNDQAEITAAFAAGAEFAAPAIGDTNLVFVSATDDGATHVYKLAAGLDTDFGDANEVLLVGILNGVTVARAAAMTAANFQA
jgi:Ca2+-binding RTX toxin-like protein